MDRKAFIARLIAPALVAAAGCSSRKRSIVVASKNFTEQNVLGEIIAGHLENRGLQVRRYLNLGGTLLAHQALTSAEIDLYPEYSGTALVAVLKLPPVSDPQVVIERVKLEYDRNHLTWLPPLGFDNSFAMVVRGSMAREFGLETVTDAATKRKKWALGVGYEFLDRHDGYASLSKAYDINFGAAPRTMDLGLLYKALLEGKVDMVAGNSTDGVLAKLDVKVLADDKRAFPPYQACIVVRRDSLERHPQLRQCLDELTGKIQVDAMRKMNFEVDVNHRQAAEVAAEFLRSAGLK